MRFAVAFALTFAVVGVMAITAGSYLSNRVEKMYAKLVNDLEVLK